MTAGNDDARYFGGNKRMLAELTPLTNSADDLRLWSPPLRPGHGTGLYRSRLWVLWVS